jgi:hypothetical protein
MNALTPIEQSTETPDIVALFEASPSIVLLDKDKGEAFYAAVKADVEAHVPDLTTAKGRDAIKALAYKVTRTKTAIVAAGKELTAEWRKQTEKVNAARNDAEERFAALAEAARKPLTDWEDAETARQDRIKTVLERLQSAPGLLVGDTSETIAARLAEVEAVVIDDAFDEYQEAGEKLRATAVAALTALLSRARQEEADRAELERLRAAEAERQAEADRAAQAARSGEDAIQATADARVAEAEAARVKAEQDAQEARDAAAERDRQEQAERDAQAQRAADDAHVLDVLRLAKEALIAATGVTDAQARAAVLAIARGQIPAVSIAY